ncbi:kinesin-like protein KIF17 isoform X4 [Phyllopteryx taeniolatus]|uniref:kinesin-like protein KIF17 isoform X4 n=1 Tax=Phyllopteryx taeniolatus TaxID=161469 RepID=UPI002AD34E91|nr:kinesin-like protein KIF17 isoform X4 [Phyllopteryx taeniolatus]
MGSESVKVVVRYRPLNDKEKALGSKMALTMDPQRCQCFIKKPASADEPPKQFTFDGTYFTDQTTERIYNESAYPLVECAENTKFLVRASYLEIYNEEIRDLLGNDTKQRLELKEHPEPGVYARDLSMHTVHSVAECETVMERGWRNRAVACTLMNKDSSRSHSIFSIHLEMCRTDAAGQDHLRAGKLNLVDPAGSERQSKTGATGERLREATKINLSLSALADGRSKYVPYRDSKLTRLPQDSLGGNTRTLMAACLSPADSNYEESLSTLRYANRAKSIRNRPRINEDPKDALLREYQEEIKKLRALVASAAALPSEVSRSSADGEKEKIQKDYEERLARLRADFSAERESKAKLQEDIAALRSSYDSKLSALEKVTSSRGRSAPTNGFRGWSRRWSAASGPATKNSGRGGRRPIRGKLGSSKLLSVHDSVQEEVRAKGQMLLKVQGKVRRRARTCTLTESGQTGDPRPADGVRGGEEGLPGRDCNYSSPERLKREAVWDEESAAWRIPDVTVQRTSLPSGGTSRGGCAEVVLHPSILCSRAGSIFHTIFDIISLSRRYCVPRFLTRPRCPPPSAVASKPRQARGPPADPEALAQVEEDGYKELLERSDSENIANAYFRFKRASQLLGGQTATGCAAPERVAPPKRRCEPGLRHATSLSPRILDSACIQWQGEEEKNQISSIMEASDRSGTTSCMLAPQWRALKNGPPKKL